MTSSDDPAAISLHESHSPQGSGVGPFTQFSALARMRAAVVFPTPRAPEKNVRVRHAIHLDRIRQRFRYMFLPDKVREGLRPPFSRNHLISHTCLGAPPFAVIAKRGFIFGVRPEKVKTFGVRQLAWSERRATSDR